MVNPKIVLLIFVSGKIVLTGAKVREEIYRAFEVFVIVANDANVSPSTPYSASLERTQSLLSHRNGSNFPPTLSTLLGLRVVACFRSHIIVIFVRRLIYVAWVLPFVFA